MKKANKIIGLISKDFSNGRIFHSQLEQRAHHLGIKSQDVEDVIQDYCLQIMEKENNYAFPVRDSMKPGENSNFGNYLRASFSNYCRNYLRQGKRKILNRGFYENDFDEKAVVFATTSSPRNPQEIAIQKEEQEKSKEVVDRNRHYLPKTWRIALHLFYSEGLRAKEIAEKTGVTRKTILRKLIKARERLKQGLATEPYVQAEYGLI